MAVGDREGLVGRDIGMGIAEPAGRLAGDEIVHRLVGEHGDLGVEQGHVDMAAGPGRLAAAQGREDRVGGVEAGEDVGEGDAGLLRLAVRIAGQVHDPAHALDDEVIAGACGIGAGLAEAGDRAIDEPRIERRTATR